MSAKSAIGIALGLLITAVIAVMMFSILNKGKDAYSKGDEQLTSVMGNMSVSEYSLYDRTTQTGSDVRTILRSTISNKEVEVLVCTKDGKNALYNGFNKGKEAADVKIYKSLAGMPLTDAVGNKFTESTDGVTTVAAGEGIKIQTGAGDTPLMVETGFNEMLDTQVAGYIASTAQFSTSVQKDINGTVRRITFIQK